MRRFDRETESPRERELLEGIAGGGGLSEAPPFPLKVQIQTKTLCNAACTMCPYPVVEGSLEHGEMSLPLYDLLLGQLEGKGVERLSLFLMNEPLLDLRLPEFIRRAKARLPGTTTVIFTNGSALTERCARSLHAAGLDEIDLSVHGFDKAAYESVMVGLSFDRLRSNLRRLLSMRREGELPGLRVKLVAVDLGAVLGSLEERDRDLFADVLVKATSNEREAIGGGTGPAPRRRPCQRPFVKAYVLHNGDVVLCNVDWRRTVILGNVAREPLEEIWRNARFRAVRLQHLARDFEPGLICATCDYPAVTEEDD